MPDKAAMAFYGVTVGILIALTREGNHMPSPRQYAKAIVGALTAGLVAAGTALADGAISGVEGVGIALAVVATFGGVYATSNEAGDADA